MASIRLDHIVKTFLLFPDLLAYSDEAPGASDASGRLAIMDAHGIDVAFLFPQRAMSMWGIADPDLAFACLHAYNEWLAEFCAVAPGRPGQPGRRPGGGPGAAADVEHRLAGLHRGRLEQQRGHRGELLLQARSQAQPAGHAVARPGLGGVGGSVLIGHRPTVAERRAGRQRPG